MNPWEMERADMVEASAPVEQPSAKPPAKSGSVSPWLMERSDTPQKAPELGMKVPDRFEQVFGKLLQAESRGKHYNPKTGALTTSSAGAQGITQLMPGTAAKPGYGIAPAKDQSEGEYLRVGRSYLQAMLTSFDGDYHKALAAYNAGAGNVRKAITAANKAGKPSDWMEYLPRKQETIPYVNKIMKGIL